MTWFFVYVITFFAGTDNAITLPVHQVQMDSMEACLNVYESFKDSGFVQNIENAQGSVEMFCDPRETTK